MTGKDVGSLIQQRLNKGCGCSSNWRVYLMLSVAISSGVLFGMLHQVNKQTHATIVAILICTSGIEDCCVFFQTSSGFIEQVESEIPGNDMDLPCNDRDGRSGSRCILRSLQCPRVRGFPLFFL